MPANQNKFPDRTRTGMLMIHNRWIVEYDSGMVSVYYFSTPINRFQVVYYFKERDVKVIGVTAAVYRTVRPTDIAVNL